VRGVVIAVESTGFIVGYLAMDVGTDHVESVEGLIETFHKSLFAGEVSARGIATVRMTDGEEGIRYLPAIGIAIDESEDYGICLGIAFEDVVSGCQGIER
jgi:hypothetical protein